MPPHDTADQCIRIPLSSHKYPNLFALVDPEDAELVNQYRWRPRKSSYDPTAFYADARISLGHNRRRFIQMHRLILDARADQVVDHINGDTLDNRRGNLRVCTRGQNSMHQRGSRSNPSGYKGVSRARSGAWRVECKKDGVRYYLGSFPTPEEAALTYNELAIRLHGEFAYLNVVEPIDAGEVTT
jgi:hypothetical protein